MSKDEPIMLEIQDVVMGVTSNTEDEAEDEG